MKPSPAISVIVPVYNMEKYVEQALDSLLSQTLRELEIIVVNDGSTDGSADIVERYARMDDRILVLHQKNAGLSGARNAGLTMATGRYIAFLDPDDWAEPEMYETLYAAAEADDCDYAFGRHYLDDEWTGLMSLAAYGYKPGLYASKDRIREEIYGRLIVRGEGAAVVWNGIYRRELLEAHSIRFGDHLILEDYVFNMQALTAVRSAVFVDLPLYHYRLRAQSLSRTLHRDLFANLVKVHALKEKLIAEGSDERGGEERSDDARWFIALARHYIYLEFMFESPRPMREKLRMISEIVNHDKTRTLLRRVIGERRRSFFALAAYLRAVPVIAAAASAFGLAYRTKKRWRG